MTKRQLIDEIVALNQTAQPAFLARFQDPDLHEYLEHLKVAQSPRLSGDPGRYEKYFSKRQTPVFRAASFGMNENVDLEQTELAERAALLGKTELPPQEDSDGSPEMTLQETTPALDPEPAAQAQDVVEPDERAALEKAPSTPFESSAPQAAKVENDNDETSDSEDNADQYVSDVQEELDEADDLDGSQYEDSPAETDELDGDESDVDELEQELEQSRSSQPDRSLSQNQPAAMISVPAQAAKQDTQESQESKPFAKAQPKKDDSDSWLF